MRLPVVIVMQITPHAVSGISFRADVHFQPAQVLKDHGIEASMNGAGSWYDNAPMESFFGTLVPGHRPVSCGFAVETYAPSCGALLGRV